MSRRAARREARYSADLMERLNSLKDNVYDLVGQIPSGRIMTYGQLAALSGHPRSARQVGQIARYGPAELPWHRVVNKNGGMALGFPGGRAIQSALLEAEGAYIDIEGRVLIEQLIWYPVQQ